MYLSGQTFERSSRLLRIFFWDGTGVPVVITPVVSLSDYGHAHLSGTGCSVDLGISF